MSFVNGSNGPPPTNGTPRNSKGWDGKLRVGKAAEQDDNDDDDVNGDEPSDHESDPGNNIHEVPGEEIDADEDLLEGVAEDETDIDLNHSRISSIPALHLERFKNIVRLCLRQNDISHVRFPANWASAETLIDLDLYDNAISSIKGLDEFTNLTSLDLSFNKIKHIKRVDHLKNLKDIYFVQNKISKIEGLDNLTGLTNLELGDNKIREIENLDTLTNLSQLWLGKNKITELKNLTPLQNLTVLSIQSNRLTSESLAHLATLPQLSELYVSHNLLTNLAALATCTKLHTIDVSSNPITSLEGMATLTHLEEFWASDCELESFEEIERELPGGCEGGELNTVYFEGNPLQKRQPALYRNKVKLALPGVKQIDATFVRLD